MNFSQKLGTFCLIVITALYVYFSFFSKEGFHLPKPNYEKPAVNINDVPVVEPETPDVEPKK